MIWVGLNGLKYEFFLVSENNNGMDFFIKFDIVKFLIVVSFIFLNNWK